MKPMDVDALLLALGVPTVGDLAAVEAGEKTLSR